MCNHIKKNNSAGAPAHISKQLLLPVEQVHQKTLKRCSLFIWIVSMFSWISPVAQHLPVFRWLPKADLHMQWTSAPNVSERGVILYWWILTGLCETICFLVDFLFCINLNKIRHWPSSATYTIFNEVYPGQTWNKLHICVQDRLNRVQINLKSFWLSSDKSLLIP